MNQPAQAGSGTASAERSWTRWLLPRVLRYRGQVLIALAASLAWTIATVSAPILQKVALDEAIVRRTSPLLPWVLGIGAVGVARYTAAMAWRYHGGRVSLGVALDVRNEIYDHLQRLDAAGHARLQSGQVVARANSDLMLVQQAVSWIPLLIGSVLNIAMALAVMVVLSPPLASVIVVVVAVVFVLTRRLQSRAYAAAWHAQQAEAEVVMVVEEAVTGARVVKAFGQENAEFSWFTQRLTDMFGSRVRAIRVRAPLLAALQAAPLIGQVLVLLLGGIFAIHGHLTVGTFLAFAGFLANLSGSARSLGAIITAAPLSRAACERIDELLSSRSSVVPPPGAVAPAPAGGRVAVERVSFRYPDGDRPVLQDLSFTVEPGETVAVVGPSGAGKSTVLQLLLRLHDVSGGSVTVDRTDVRQWPLPALRSRIGIVFENSFLFSTSIAANIAYARPDASQAQIESAARAAAIHDFVAALPDGYDTQVGEQGLALSGGQRQRIALARALLAEPDLLILDDATSAIDVDTERVIHVNLAARRAGRATLMVAYRESTVELADRVVLLHDGTVQDEGTHTELLARSALYRRLLGDETATATTGAQPGRPTTADAWSSTGNEPVPPGTAHLRTALTALPPVIDEPSIDPQQEASASEGFRLGAFLRPQLRALGVGLALVVADAVATLLGPLLVRQGVDAALVTRSSRLLLGVCAAFLAIALADWWDVWAMNLYTNRTTERLLYALRLRIFAHLQKLGVDYYDRVQTGRTMTRITSDVDSVTQLFQVGLVNVLVAMVTCIGMTAVLVALNAQLTLVVLAVVPPATAATIWYRHTAGPAYERARERLSILNSVLHESIAGVRVTQAFVREDHNYRHFRHLAQAQRRESDLALRTTSRYVSIIEGLSTLAIAATLFIGGHLIADGTIVVGTLLAFLLYLAQVFAPIQQLATVFDVYQRARVGLSRISSLLAQTTSTPDGATPTPPTPRGDIELRNVTLRYEGVREPAVRDVSVQIPAGQRVAFVGQTGAGKSTIAKLVTRFYDPTAGQVLVDGVPLTDRNLPAFRRTLGYVPQEPFLFSRSIRDNIAYGRPEATDREVEQAARAVGVHDFITSLRGGYHHVITERGRSLSAGQRQLICLARALLVDPTILVLDEATSNLDLASEERVNHAMKAASVGRTTIVIAHRPQSLRWVDRVVTVHAGTLVADRLHTGSGAE